MKIRTRFAPSPTGYLHLGNMRTALFNALLAYANGGTFLLRIEDTDFIRSTAGFAEAIQEDLQWLGLQWLSESEPGVIFQSKRQAIYADYYRKLQITGVAYPCFCTEQRLAHLREAQRLAHQPPGYDGHCYQLSMHDVQRRQRKGEVYHLRFRVPDSQEIVFHDRVKGEQRFSSDRLHDFVIQRSNGRPTFLYCNALDDALMGITHVLRGEDHLTNTAKQLLVLQALDLDPPAYGHLPLISQQANTVPLSKRDNSFSLRSLRSKGYLPLAILNYLARLGHTISSTAWMNLEQLANAFSIACIHTSYAHFDVNQLNFWQKQAMRQQSPAAFWDALDSMVQNRVPSEVRAYFIKVMQAMVVLPSEVESWVTLLFTDPLEYNAEVKLAIQQADATFWPQLLNILKVPTVIDDDSILSQQLKMCLNHVNDKAQRKVHWKALRAALTNRFAGPDLLSLIRLLGVSRACGRLQMAAALSHSNLATC